MSHEHVIIDKGESELRDAMTQISLLKRSALVTMVEKNGEQPQAETAGWKAACRNASYDTNATMTT